MVKSRTLRFAGVPRLSIALENEKAARRRPSVFPEWACQRTAEVPALVITTGLPALNTWVDWAVWL